MDAQSTLDVSKTDVSQTSKASDSSIHIEHTESDYTFSMSSKSVTLKLAEGEVQELPPEFLQEARAELLKRTNERRSTEIIIKKGFQFNAKEKKMVIPVAFLEQDAVLRSIMLSCAAMLNFSVIVYRDPQLNCKLKRGLDDILTGILYALGGPRNTKLTHAKQGRELSYAIGMSLRLKGEAQRWNVEGAIRPNNFFFANNPGETVEGTGKRRIQISYGAKLHVISPFESVTAGMIFYKIISSTLMTLGTQDFHSLEEADLFIQSNIITFDDMVKKHWIEVMSEDKRTKTKVVSQVRKATFPSRNAMLLNEELEAIKSLTQPFFSSVEDLRKDYLVVLFTTGYNAYNKLLAQRFGVRHTILQNIASVTTKRLQGLRKVLNLQDLKKKQVTRERLVTYLSAVPSPLTSFREELERLLNSEQRQVAFCCIAAEKGIDSTEVLSYLCSKVAPSYVHAGIYKKSDKDPLYQKVYSPDEEAIRLYETVHKKQISMKRLSALIGEYFGKIRKSETPEYRGLLYKKVEKLAEVYIQHWNECKAIMTQKYPDLISKLSPIAKLLDTVSPHQFDANNWTGEACIGFLKLYKNTTRNNTLSSKEDTAIHAFIKERTSDGESMKFFRSMI